MSSESGFLGMRGTGDWTNEERPTNFREGLLRMYPNGDMPLTAILSKGKSRKVDDPNFKWWSKTFQDQGGALAGIYTDEAMASAITTGTIAAQTVIYAKVAEAVVNHFRPGHIVLCSYDADTEKFVFGKVLSKQVNGATSKIAILVLKAVGASGANGVNYIDVIGNSNSEGGTIPEGISYDPVKFDNYSQIFRTPLSITRTQQRTRMRIGNTYQELKREALEYHGIEMEYAMMFGEKVEWDGSNGQKERTTQGLLSFIREHNSTNGLADFRTSTGLTWLQAGEDWFEERLEVLFRYGRNTKLAVVGSGALLGINRLVKSNGLFSLTAETGSYGIKVVRWVTPYGELLLKRHPLLSYKAHRRYTMMILEPENLGYDYIDDTMYKQDDTQKKAGQIGLDGLKEEYLTEAGFEFHHPQTFAYFQGIGQDGTA